jgi:hypothetical protein
MKTDRKRSCVDPDQIRPGRREIKIERFAGHHEAREALVLSIAGVTAIMLTAYLILLILY